VKKIKHILKGSKKCCFYYM